MKIVIISDIHDNLINLEKVLRFCRKQSITDMICCGDVTNDETLRILGNSFINAIHLVRGNAEIYLEGEVKKYKNIKYYNRIGRFFIKEKIIGFCHEPYLIDYVLKKGKCNIIFYGHTHKPWEEKKNSVKLINPGNVAGTRYKATFAVWNIDSGQLELKILNEMN